MSLSSRQRRESRRILMVEGGSEDLLLGQGSFGWGRRGTLMAEADYPSATVAMLWEKKTTCGRQVCTSGIPSGII
jgi:hypothetical protein